MASAFGRWLAHRVMFRGRLGRAVDAPGRDPIKIRNPNRDAAELLASRLVDGLQTRGLADLNELL
ncbi:hypothetical protein AB0M47_11765 [Hamadaea sp. NPDC051192]|uniref:hypothetical protein n=1 Tax=Hamadaea sp. NPDC051192 TaxID=3154940 RepID=UPI0034344312